MPISDDDVEELVNKRLLLTEEVDAKGRHNSKLFLTGKGVTTDLAEGCSLTARRDLFRLLLKDLVLEALERERQPPPVPRYLRELDLGDGDAVG